MSGASRLTMGRAVLVGMLALLAALCVGVAVAGTDRLAGGAAGAALLPDLDVRAPDGLVVETVPGEAGPRFRLGFVSAAENVGAGALVIRGHRPSLAGPEMAADQIVALEGGGTAVRPGVGTLLYVEEDTHQHWHLLEFMSYELRRASDFALVVPDHKSGFCLGDRYDADPAQRLPGEPGERVYKTNCGPEERSLLAIEEGISVGWGDVYEAWRDQQYLDVTGLPAGRYVLVHRVNAGRPLAESRYGNNASAVRISLTWPNGTGQEPAVRVLQTCERKARCGAPKR
jgi:hypothetical protein